MPQACVSSTSAGWEQAFLAQLEQGRLDVNYQLLFNSASGQLNIVNALIRKRANINVKDEVHDSRTHDHMRGQTRPLVRRHAAARRSGLRGWYSSSRRTVCDDAGKLK